MKVDKPDQLTRLATLLAVGIVVLAPFHAFLTVWLASIVGHYTLLRMWDNIATLLVAVGAAIVIIRRPVFRRQIVGDVLLRCIVLYVMLSILLGIVSWLRHEVSITALGYGLTVNLRFLLFFAAVYVLVRAKGHNGLNLTRVVLVPAAVVGIVALLQYSVLPHDFLKHFGYRHSTIDPVETINNDPRYIRTMATLRGANPLGAYMVAIAGLVAALWHKNRRWAYSIIGVLVFLALWFSFSRSAWIGAVIAVTVAIWLRLPSKKIRIRAAIGGLILVVVVAAAAAAFRTSGGLQNALFHTSDTSKVAVSSNQAHASASRDALKDVLAEPFGRGPGTAGPASVYNHGHATRIAENYYLQIAQEAGWAGLILFLACLALVAQRLYQARHIPMALGVLAGLVGVSFVCLLTHAWADDTLAFTWWGIAAFALGQNSLESEKRA